MSDQLHQVELTASFLDTPRQMDCFLDAVYNCYIHFLRR